MKLARQGIPLVPGEGLEPTQPKLLVPKTSASTNSATRAGKGIVKPTYIGVNVLIKVY